jgi:hypothetical protein
MSNLVLTKEDPEVKCVATAVKPDWTTEDNGHHIIMKLINRWSSWHQLKRATAWILKVRDRLRDKVRARRMGHTDFDSRANSRSNADLERAENTLIKFEQNRVFSEELRALQAGKPVARSSIIRRLDPKLMDGMLHIGGRLSKSAMPVSAKHQVILPKAQDSPISGTILRQVHKDLKHGGRNHMLSRLREYYWIPHANSAIRKIIKNCVTCRRVGAHPRSQKMADLPQDRVTPDVCPFTNSGCDFFGPFEIKRGRSTIRRYGVIFCCQSLRAVHLEMAESLDTDSCINAIRRFIAMRGQVQKIRSDNGTNFVAAERELRDAVQSLDNKRIKTA